MLNYVMLYLLAYLLTSQSLLQAPGASNAITPPITSNAHLPLLAGTHLRINAGFLIALPAALGVWWLLSRTATGFEFRIIGANARVTGGRDERGTQLDAGDDDRWRARRAGRVHGHPRHGLHAQPAELRHLRDRRDHSGPARPRPPGGVVLAGLLFGALHAGSPGMQASTGTPVQIVQVLQALIVLFVAAPPLIRAMYRCARPGSAGSARRCRRGGTRDDSCFGRALPVLLARTPGAQRRRAVRRPVRGADHVRGLRPCRHPGVRAHAHGDATFSFTPEFAKVRVPNLMLAAAATCYVCGAVTLALAAVRLLEVLGII